MEVTRLFDLLPHYAKYFPKDDAVCGKENGVWVRYSIQDYIKKVNYISYGLMQLGIKKGDRIASISNNRPEWNFLDMAIQQLGAIHVSIYPTISESEYKYILHHADVKMIFVAGWELLRKIENVIAEMPQLQNMVYTFRNLRGFRHLNEIIELGVANPCPQYLEDIKKSISPDDVVTLIYTSGTTGNPKGVMLTHSNILNNVKAVVPIIPATPQSKVVSYLPLCHAYERMLIYAWHYVGVSIYYAENLAKIVDNMNEIKPDIFTTVPRLLEKVYDKILATGRKLKGIKHKLFFWAVDIANQYDFNASKLYRRKLRIARKLVLRQWKAALGGNLKVVVSGGAAIQEKINRIFWAMEVPVLEGYGLTETSPVIAVNHPRKNIIKFGCVGVILPTVQVKFAEDGEILTKGPCVMKGYYKDEALTKEVIDEDGWFHTGDIGTMVKDSQGEYLKITDRKKEIFKLSLGKYIAPQVIENKLKTSEFIDNLMVIGENEKFVSAIIVPSFKKIVDYLQSQNKQAPVSREEMSKSQDVIDVIQKEVDKVNESLADHEKIKRFRLVPDEWDISTGELSQTLKLKRKVVYQKYDSLCREIYYQTK